MTDRKRIAIVTATRAEYGLLQPLIRRVYEDRELKLDLIVTGTHLSEKHGFTIREIEEDGFPISCKLPILEEDNTPYGVSLTMANALRQFALRFREYRPDMLVLLGDRTEMLGVAGAALNERVPIAHIAGGELTEGAVDDCVRHSLTKMSYLHFTSTELYRRRVIQLGEAPERVFNVGSLSVENILHAPLLTEAEVRGALRIGAQMPYAVVTFHPVTQEAGSAAEQTETLCEAMEGNPTLYYLMTRANADAGGDLVNRRLERFAAEHENARLVDSLGMKRYLSAVKYAAFVLGNSSSGMTEAPALGTPTVNIGDRQAGRIVAETVLCCKPERQEIEETMRTALKTEHVPTDLYGDGNTSVRIVREIKKTLSENHMDWKKKFYDILPEVKV